LIYRRAEHSFDFVPSNAHQLAQLEGSEGTSSILLGTLQIASGVETGRFLYPWGYYPRTLWRSGHVDAVPAKRGSIEAKYDEKPIPGLSIPYSEVREWDTIYDEEAVVVHITRSYRHPVEYHVEFATGVVAGLHGKQLTDLWMHPLIQD
jgi:hypothetical protein